jgi:hypothetical protein
MLQLHLFHLKRKKYYIKHQTRLMIHGRWSEEASSLSKTSEERLASNQKKAIIISPI